MIANNEVRLLLRFQQNIPQNREVILHKFQNFNLKNQSNYTVKTSEHHIWLNLIDEQKKYYSPHLHLELEELNTNETNIRGLYGPDPTLWTFFMFLHFVLAGLFVIFSIFLYTDWVLKNSLSTSIYILVAITIIWISLYFIARIIRSKDMHQMKELEKIYQQIISEA